jgi:sugar O-acyltransferase (sialic acid O-acetyltransferase NeuD family)
MENINICIFGASGHGKVVADCVISTNKLVMAIFDDAPKNTIWNSISIKHSQELPLPTEPIQLVIAVGNNATRKRLQEKLILYAYATVKHNTSIIASGVVLGEGTVIMPNAIINSDAVVGRHVIINTAAVIEHDCVLEDFVHISPKAVLSGNVFVGEGTHVGVGAVVIPGIKIGKWCTIGAGAVIIRDVPDGATVVGNPGRVL